MQQIKVLIAEDTKEARDLIVEGLQEYSILRTGKPDLFRIDKTEKFEKAINFLDNSFRDKSYYEIFFCDIDFTESGGRRDAGYDLIEKAFEVCPLTKICTYSGQFHGKDLWEKYEFLKHNGLIVHTMDKSHSEGGTSEWLINNIDDLVKKVNEERVYFELWYNHNLVWEKIKNQKINLENIEKFDEIHSNLQTITALLQRKKQFDADIVLFRLIIQLYHRCLEIFVTGDKTDTEIFNESKNNKKNVYPFVKDIIKEKDFDLSYNDKRSFLHKICSFSPTEIYRYGHIINWYRNGSVHPQKKFSPEFGNVIFSNLTLALYVLDNKKEIKIENIKSGLKSFGNNSFKDLRDLIEFIEENY
ncbi:MAG: hypothetical protein N2043_03175 [Ignavibacterium sp.]|nr:hypothetical protein [Ignavibacterium sp.]